MDKNKIKELISRMTLEEKASLCSGKDFWTTKPISRLGIGSFVMSDGPHGLRKENEDDNNVGMKSSFPATAFPPAVSLAATWNEDLAKEVGDALGKQCLDQKVDILLGPGVNIKRSPLCGRNFEYFSEDPFLAGKMGAAYIEGVQQNGIGTSLKHFCANNNEHLRMTISSIVDERALREIYLPAFETCVKKQPYTVMASYNKINGVYASDNVRLLDEVLRKEWGFKGLVVSDWNATNDRVEGIRAGMDLEMPASGGKNDSLIVEAVKKGTLDESALDKVVERILTLLFKCEKARKDDYKADYEGAHELARRVAEESIILLKNDENLLPADEENDLLVIGALAKHSRYQGSGSSRINPYKLLSFTDCLTERGKKFDYAEGYTLKGNGHDERLYAEAINKAKNFEGTIVCFIGLTDNYESEGYDRTHLSLPAAHDKLVNALKELGKDVVFVLCGGSPVLMPWLKNTSTLINAYLPGEAGGEAVYDVIFGKANPSGKLAETYPLAENDSIASKYFPMGPINVEYRESIYVGYRYYDAAKKEVAFPFGYGLSYTTFEYSDLKCSQNEASFTVKNTGKFDGAEVCQLYISDKEPVVFKAPKELKGFKKVFLKAGESAKVTIPLDMRSFAFFNTTTEKWYAPKGEYEVLIGSSSRDIRLKGTVSVDFGEVQPIPDYATICPQYYDIENSETIDDSQFHNLYGKTIAPNVAPKRGEFNYNTTIGDFSCCLIGKIIIKVAPALIKSQVPDADMTTMIMLTQGMKAMPLRGLTGITSGLVDTRLIDGMLLWGNKHRLRGLIKMIGGIFGSIYNINKKDEANARRKDLKRQQKEQEKLLAQQQKEQEKLATQQQKDEEKRLALEEKEKAKQEKERVKLEKEKAKAEKEKAKQEKSSQK